MATYHHVANTRVGRAIRPGSTRRPTATSGPGAGRRVIARQGDPNGTTTIKSIGDTARKLGLNSAPFTSNAEGFFDLRAELQGQPEVPPRDEKSVMVRTYKRGMTIAVGCTWHYNLHQLTTSSRASMPRAAKNIHRVMRDLQWTNGEGQAGSDWRVPTTTARFRVPGPCRTPPRSSQPSRQPTWPRRVARILSHASLSVPCSAARRAVSLAAVGVGADQRIEREWRTLNAAQAAHTRGREAPARGDRPTAERELGEDGGPLPSALRAQPAAQGSVCAARRYADRARQCGGRLRAVASSQVREGARVPLRVRPGAGPRRYAPPAARHREAQRGLPNQPGDARLLAALGETASGRGARAGHCLAASGAGPGRAGSARRCRR